MVFILNSNIEKEKIDSFILEVEQSYIDGMAVPKDGKVCIQAGRMVVAKRSSVNENHECENKAMMGAIGYDQ